MKKHIKKLLREGLENKDELFKDNYTILCKETNINENLLNEKLTEIDDDVNLLYNEFFRDDIEKINRTGIITRDMFKFGNSDTSKLQSEESIEGNKLNACTIKINNNSGNNYKPSTREIRLSVNKQAFDFVLSNNGNLKDSIDELDDTQKKSLKQEFSEEKIKGSIHHELTHWLDDTIHNRHITKMLKKSVNNKAKELNKTPVNSTKMEIQGQIHNIKQLHNKYNDIWDDIEFSDLFGYSPALNTIQKNLPDKLRKQWIRDIKTRMHRENLLRKNMVKS